MKDIKVENIVRGHGASLKVIMRDGRLSPEAKAIYVYICSFAKEDTAALPGLSIMAEDLGLSENRFKRHRKQLIDFNYITVERAKSDDGLKNIYTLVENPVPLDKSARNASEDEVKG